VALGSNPPLQSNDYSFINQFIWNSFRNEGNHPVEFVPIRKLKKLIDHLRNHWNTAAINTNG